MQHVPSVLPAEPINGLTCGIDWARDDHAVAIVDRRGCEVHRSAVEHSSAGLHELVGLLARTGATEVAIERPDGPVVDALLDAGITVVVISPNQVKNLRGRYGSAGNKDDRFDAYVQVHDLTEAGMRHGQDDRVPVVDVAQMTGQRLVEDAVRGGTIVCGSLPVTGERSARGWLILLRLDRRRRGFRRQRIDLSY